MYFHTWKGYFFESIFSYITVLLLLIFLFLFLFFSAPMENVLLSSYLQYVWKITLRVLLVAITKLCEASKKKITACDLEMDERFFQYISICQFLALQLFPLVLSAVTYFLFHQLVHSLSFVCNHVFPGLMKNHFHMKIIGNTMKTLCCQLGASRTGQR